MGSWRFSTVLFLPYIKDVFMFGLQQVFYKENVRCPVWICRDPISMILGTRFEILKRLKKPWSSPSLNCPLFYRVLKTFLCLVFSVQLSLSASVTIAAIFAVNAALVASQW